MMTSETGLLLCSTGGLFLVRTEGGETIPCTARGSLRNRRVVPVAGDQVAFERTEQVLLDVLPRRNALSRPPCANMDDLVLVISTVDPVPNLRILDQLLVIAAEEQMRPVLVFTKEDRQPDDGLAKLYADAGYLVFPVNGLTGAGTEALKAELTGKTSLVLGNSGVGKSTLLNALEPTLELLTGETSKKLGRGRHTTRCVTLYPLTGGGYIADTPGFSTVDLLCYGLADERSLCDDFPEFAPYLGHCRFADCTHVREDGCAVLAALNEGKIAPSRHESYAAFYTELKKVHPWQQKGANKKGSR